MAVLKDLIVHGRSRFINGIDADAVHANLIDANDGIFKTITTTTLDAETITTDMLTAQNARVAQTLTVDGTISTNKWEAANIANIGGNFYISPTGKSDSGNITVTKTGSTTINGVSVGVYTLVVGSASFGVTSTNSTIWGTNSKVIFTGSIAYNSSKKYPLGTCNGTMTSVSTGSGTLTGFTITGVNSPALDVFFKEQGMTSVSSTACTGYEMQISVYQSYYSSALHPIGILLTSYGKEKKQYIDIYGGSNVLSDSSTGFATPSLRIGQLDGLDNIAGQTPSGWGIYTTNGYFSGTVVAALGKIGSGSGAWTIGNSGTKSYIYTGTLGQANSAYISTGYGTTSIAGSGTLSNTTWAYTAGQNFGVTIDGTLYAKNAEISGNVAATNGFTVTKDNKTLTVIDGTGMKIYKSDDSSSSPLGIFSGSSVEFGNPNINRFVMNAEGLTISNTSGASIGTIRLSTARASNAVQLVNNDYTLVNTTTNRSIERDGNISTNWIVSTPYVYSDNVNNISNAVVTFKTYQLQNATETSYNCTLSSKSGNVISGSTGTINMSYDTSTGIISITIPKSAYHKEQVFDESYCAELDIVGSGNIKYGKTSKTTEISLSETPISGTTFSVNIPWLGEDVWTSCTAGTAWSQPITIDDYGIEDGDNTYLVDGTIIYNGTKFIFTLNPAFTRTTQTIIDEETGEVTEEDVDTVVSFTEKTVPITLSAKDFHAYGFYVKTATIQVNSAASKGNYLFGTTSLVNGQDITRSKQNVMTMGTGLIANNNNQLVIGQYNATDSEDAAFVVGVGTADNNRRTSFKVWKSGSAGFGDNTQSQVQLFAQTKNYYEAFLRIHDSTSYGHTTVFKSDGNMIIGSGESPTNFYTQKIDGAVNADNERLFLTSDKEIYLYTNANTIGSRKRFSLYTDGWIDLPGGLTFNTTTNGTKKKPIIYTYNNSTANYGCLGFRAAGKVRPYFAFWTNQKDAGDIGRFYIEQGEVHTSNGTPFRSNGNLTVDKNSILKGTLSVTKAATLSSTLSVSGRTTLAASTINGIITAGSGSYSGQTLNFTYIDGAGNKTSAYAYKWGPVVHFTVCITTTSTIAAGANYYHCTINETSYRPRQSVYGVGYYGARSLVGGITSAGEMTLRNASSSSIASGAELWVSFTYLV